MCNTRRFRAMLIGVLLTSSGLVLSGCGDDEANESTDVSVENVKNSQSPTEYDTEAEQGHESPDHSNDSPELSGEAPVQGGKQRGAMGQDGGSLEGEGSSKSGQSGIMQGLDSSHGAQGGTIGGEPGNPGQPEEAPQVTQ